MLEHIRPRFAGLIRNGFSRREDFGRHVVIGALFTFLFMGMFFGIMEELADHDLLFRADYSTHTFFDMHRTPALTLLAVFFTTLGNFTIVTLGEWSASPSTYIF